MAAILVTGTSTGIGQATAIHLARRGHLDALVNNAGVGFAGRLEEIPLSDIRQLMETSFLVPCVASRP